jgi:hypothetical protein
MAEVVVNPDTTVVLRHGEAEARVLLRLQEELRALLVIDPRSEDPVRRRLFPDAYEAPDDTRAYREMVGNQLLEDKLHGLDELEQRVGRSGAVDVTLAGDQIDLWLTAINDLRLALGTRLEVDEAKMSADIEDDPEAPAMALLHWLGWLQESLLEARAGAGL